VLVLLSTVALVSVTTAGVHQERASRLASAAREGQPGESGLMLVVTRRRRTALLPSTVTGSARLRPST